MTRETEDQEVRKSYWTVKNKYGEYYAEGDKMLRYRTFSGDSKIIMLFDSSEHAFAVAGYGDRIVKVTLNEEEMLEEGEIPVDKSPKG